MSRRLATLATGLAFAVAGPGVAPAHAGTGQGSPDPVSEAAQLHGVFGPEECVARRTWEPDPVRWCPGMALAAAEPPPAEPQPKATVPSAQAVSRARRYLERRKGIKSFAVIDTDGRLRGAHLRRPYVSASVVKAMLLVGYLRNASARGLGEAERGLLGPMIRRSGNDEATAVYGVLGDRGLRAVARAARMRDFSVYGGWATSQVTAADQARLFERLNRLIPERHRDYGRELLSSVVAEQSWGIPAAARPRWRVYFKGGWRRTERGRLVHQAGRLEDEGRVLSIAVLTDGDPSHGYGTRTIRGVTRELLSDPAPGPATE